MPTENADEKRRQQNADSKTRTENTILLYYINQSFSKFLA